MHPAGQFIIGVFSSVFLGIPVGILAFFIAWFFVAGTIYWVIIFPLKLLYGCCVKRSVASVADVEAGAGSS